MISHILNIPIPIAEKIVRAVLVYFFLILMLRLFGKRELAQLNPFDFIVLLTLSNTVQNAIIGEDNSLSGGLIGAAALLLINFVVVRLMFRHPKLDGLLGGKPTVLIRNGHVDKTALASELLTGRELRIAANRQGMDEIREIEPNGTFTFKKKQTLTTDEMHAQLLARLDAIEQRLT